MTNPKISILLPAYKSINLLTNVFYPSFYKNVQEDVELIVYDNGGNLLFDTETHLSANIHPMNCFMTPSQRQIRFKAIGGGKNIGLNAALNECAKVATGDYFYLPHTDMYLMPGWDTTLLSACRNFPPTSFLLCSRSIEPIKGHTNYHIIKNYGMEYDEFDKERLVNEFEDYKDGSIVVGARMPFFMHRKLWDKMGGVDSHYFSYCTDDDLIQEAYHNGCRRFWMVYDSLVYHLQGKSNQQQHVDRDRNEPYEYFIDKWKKRGYENASHPGQWHPRLINFNHKVK